MKRILEVSDPVVPVNKHKNVAQIELRIAAFTQYPYDTAPGQRFRIEQWEPYLLQSGISIKYFSFADPSLHSTLPKPGNFMQKGVGLIRGFLRRFCHLFELRKFDVVMIYRAATMAGPAFFERLIKWTGIPIVYDFDDAIFLNATAPPNRSFAWLKFAGKTASICRMSSAVTVGNAYLADYAKQYSNNVKIVPSSVDLEKYEPPPAARSDRRVVIGWTGSSTSQKHLELFAKMLARVLATRKDIELHVHSDREPDLPGIDHTWHRWTPDNEVDVISQFDIGIMPMPADEWSLGKCSMKALLYMSLGIPTVCSNVGANRDLIVDGENGFLCLADDEWIEKLGMLINDRILRHTMGSAGRRTVMTGFSGQHCADLFAEAVKSAVLR